MTLRDLTPLQRQRLIQRSKSQYTYWNSRPPTLGLKDQKDCFLKGYNSGVKAVLNILLTPKNDN